jgi:putative MATE family efflux protein
MSSLKYNLTEGKILSKLMLISLPLMGAQAIQMLHNMVDMFLLGRISSDAVAASGSASMFIWLSLSLYIIGSAGAQIGVSQSIGKKKLDDALKFSNSSSLISLILGLLYGSLLFFFSDQLIAFFNIQEVEVNQMASTYLRIIGIGVPFYFVNFTLIGTFNGSGNSRIPFIIQALGLLSNIILNPILIFVLQLGIAGAAISTVIAYIISFCGLFYLVRFSRYKPLQDYQVKNIFNIKISYIKQILRWTIPMSIENFVFPALTMIISRFIASYGADAIATYRIGSQVESLTWLVGTGFGTAVTTFVGQNYGANKWTRIHEGVKVSIIMMTFYGLLVTFTLYFGAAFLFRLFVHETNVISLGIEYLRIFALIQTLVCIEFCCSGAFRGIGKTKIPSIISISSNIFRVILVFILVQSHFGLNGIWAGMAIGRITISILLIISYYFVIYRQKDTLVSKAI